MESPPSLEAISTPCFDSIPMGQDYFIENFSTQSVLQTEKTFTSKYLAYKKFYRVHCLFKDFLCSIK